MPATSKSVTKRVASVIERFCQRHEFHARDLQVDTVRDRIHLDARQRMRPARQRR